MLTMAVRDGDGWVINGSKRFITNGNVARYCVLAAITDKSAGYKGISTFIVDFENTPGFRVGKVEEKLGILMLPGRRTMVFEDARLPAEACWESPAKGFRQMLTTLDGGRIGSASQALGIGRAALENRSSTAKPANSLISRFQASRRSSGSWPIWLHIWMRPSC